VTDQPGPPSDSGDAVPPVTPPPATPPPPPPPPSGAATPPPPPPPPAPAPGTAGGNVDVGTAVSWAFAKFGQYALIFIGLAAVVFVIRLIQVLIGNALTNSLSGNCANTVITENGAIIAGGNCVASMGTTITAGIVSGIIFGSLAWIATIGIYRAALRTSDGEVPAFSDLTTGKNLGKYIVVSIVFGILSTIGLLLCIIPGLLVFFFLQFSPLYALDKGQGVGAAFRSSIDAVKQAPVPVILTMIVNAIAAFLGTWFYGILTLVALPFAALFTVHVYRQLNKEEIAP